MSTPEHPLLGSLSPNILASTELALIRDFYGHRRAKRSGVLYINHILEGLSILAQESASLDAMRAYCLHPLLQGDEDLKSQAARVCEVVSSEANGPWVLMLAMEYRNIANSYLSDSDLPANGFSLSPLHEVNQMLIADKVQNHRDFMFFHRGYHPNSVTLEEYFDVWLRILKVHPSGERHAHLVSKLPEPRWQWLNPLPLLLMPTRDPESFREMAEGTTGIPLQDHPGAFGVKRTHHVHEGVDLYCLEGTEVTAVEPGKVVAVLPFTGPKAGMEWWLDTDVILVEGPSGVVAYGEMSPCVKEGDAIEAGDLLGHVARVLRNDKGRPTSMLHIELHAPGTRECPEWVRQRPGTLRDPTPFLLGAVSTR